MWYREVPKGLYNRASPGFGDFAASSFSFLTQLGAKSPNLWPKRCPIIPPLYKELNTARNITES